jgi:hypothetical protein
MCRPWAKGMYTALLLFSMMCRVLCLSSVKEAFIYLFLALYLLSVPQLNAEEALLGTAYFDTTGKVLTPESELILMDIAKMLQTERNLVIDICGYANAGGSSSANVIISQRMADQVRDHLAINLGVSSAQMNSLGWCSSEKSGRNRNEENKTQKSRIEITIRPPDAILTWFENDVRVQPPALIPDWLDPLPNYYLYSGYKVATGKRSHAHIQYPNKGMLKLDEDAVAIIHSMDLQQSGRSPIDKIELQRGTLETILADSIMGTDSTFLSPVPTDVTPLKAGTTSVDKKLETLIVAYQGETETSEENAKPMIDTAQETIINQRIKDSIPANFGIGMVIGEPTGVNMKKWISEKSALGSEIGWSFPGERIHISVDYLVHFPEWIGKANLYPYLVIGARLKIRTEQGSDQFRSGIRFGAGIEYICGRLGLYGEIDPVVDMLPDTRFGLEGGIGARCYF